MSWVNQPCQRKQQGRSSPLQLIKVANSGVSRICSRGRKKYSPRKDDHVHPLPQQNWQGTSFFCGFSRKNPSQTTPHIIQRSSILSFSHKLDERRSCLVPKTSSKGFPRKPLRTQSLEAALSLQASNIAARQCCKGPVSILRRGRPGLSHPSSAVGMCNNRCLNQSQTFEIGSAAQKRVPKGRPRLGLVSPRTPPQPSPARSAVLPRVMSARRHCDACHG